MPSPLERLEKIIAAQVPAQVVFKVQQKNINHAVSLAAVKTKEAECKVLAEDAELQASLSKELEEHWDADNGRYYVNANPEQLWGSIKRTILRQYDEVSDRCTATKRKSKQFIRDIKLDDKHLPNYLIQVFLKVRSPAYDAMSMADARALFEQFESLRRTYGKRS